MSNLAKLDAALARREEDPREGCELCGFKSWGFMIPHPPPRYCGNCERILYRFRGYRNGYTSLVRRPRIQNKESPL